MNNKLETISNLFEDKEIRSIWNSEREEYYFSVVDVVRALTESDDARKYWSVLKLRLKKEGSELTTICSQLKLKSSDGKKDLSNQSLVQKPNHLKYGLQILEAKESMKYLILKLLLIGLLIIIAIKDIAMK